MMLAETLPDPNSYASIGWWCVIAAALAFGINQIWELVNRTRGEAPHPPNSQLEADHRALKARVKILEDWKESLIRKMDSDKTEILEAGERREQTLKTEIQSVATRVSSLQDRISDMPAEIVALFSNAKNVLGGGK